jgi:dTDP-glucose 4,6-dehydratase
MNNRKLLVTGGAGFIGSSFVTQSINRGDQVVVLDLLTYAGHLENLDHLKNNNNFFFIEGDITNYELVSSLLKKYDIDNVVNFAAESHVDNSITGPKVFIDTNIIGTFNMLQASLHYYQNLAVGKKENFRYLQISTDEVYGTLGDTGKFHEEYPMQPNSPYSASKASADHLTRSWFETYGLPTIITNCSNNYGPRQYPEKLIPKVITNALQHKELPIYGDGKNIRDWIHVEDHCNGVYLALTKGRVGQSYCFGGNAEKTNIDLVNDICRELDNLVPMKNGNKYNSLIKFVADRLGHDRRYAIEDNKAVKELDFTRKYNILTGLNDTISWYLNNEKWCQAVTNKDVK